MFEHDLAQAYYCVFKSSEASRVLITKVMDTNEHRSERAAALATLIRIAYANGKVAGQMDANQSWHKARGN